MYDLIALIAVTFVNLFLFYKIEKTNIFSAAIRILLFFYTIVLSLVLTFYSYTYDAKEIIITYDANGNLITKEIKVFELSEGNKNILLKIFYTQTLALTIILALFLIGFLKNILELRKEKIILEI
ncbi:MAG: hypothetical protein RMJ67_06645 [Elusimicrobiota bacterium]|nr:hypothetical protein [Endomicrobiia bacterium]MDW8166172.1 hypothetical protein [Elusimicrobiota bacterium]